MTTTLLISISALSMWAFFIAPSLFYRMSDSFTPAKYWTTIASFHWMRETLLFRCGHISYTGMLLILVYRSNLMSQFDLPDIVFILFVITFIFFSIFKLINLKWLASLPEKTSDQIMSQGFLAFWLFQASTFVPWLAYLIVSILLESLDPYFVFLVALSALLSLSYIQIRVLGMLGFLHPLYLDDLLTTVQTSSSTPTRHVRVYIINIQGKRLMNAFADPFSNSIVLTKSIIESLSVEELQAVVKHELCHLSHRWLWLFVLVLHVVLIHFSIFNDSLVEQTLVIRILLFILLMSVLRVIRKVLARFSENRADDKYLASDSEKHTLAKALIHIYRERLIPSKSSIFSAHRDLPTRIRRLAPDLVYEIPDDRHVHKDIQRKLLLLFTLALLPPLSLLIPLIILDINLNLPATGFMLFGLLCALILDSLISHYTKKLKQFHALPWFLRGSRRLLLALSVGGFLSVLALYYWGVTVRGASLLIFLELVITIAVIDAIYLVIPHPLTICGITLSGFMSYWTTNAWLISLVPIIVCVVALCTFNRISKILLNRPMIGGGDIMLVTMVGGYLGYDALRSILLLTIIFSLLCMLAPCLRRRASAGEFPLGPVISLFSMIILLTGTI